MGRPFTIFVAALAATGSFLFGYDSGVMTDVIESPNFLAYFQTTQTSAIIGAINSTFSGGGRWSLSLTIMSSLTVNNSRDRGLAGRLDHGPLWPQNDHPDGCLHLPRGRNPAGSGTESLNDPDRSNPGRVGCRAHVHVRTGLPSRTCAPKIPRHDRRIGTADDWDWIYC